MDNQHKLVKGYRDLSKQEIDAMNSIKLAEQDIGQLFQQVKVIPGVDQRCMSIAKTQLQQAFSWFVRSVAQPLDVYELVIQPTTYADRIKVELDELQEKLTKLKAFLGSPAVSKLGKKQIDALELQAELMGKYAEVLNERLADAE